jgi:hypothetical protein
MNQRKNMKKTFTCMLAGILCVLCSCVAPQKNSDGQSGDFTFTVALKNNTPFDLEIVDDSRVIPGHGEKRITLPVFFGELNDGYHINYRVRLLDEVFIKIPRTENILIKQDQNNVVIETADFQSDSCFLILQNDEKQTVSLKMDNAYLSALVQGEPRRYGPTPYLGPGKSYVYEIKSGPNNIVLERDQYRALPLPFSRALPGYIYTFLFKGNEITLTDARPLQRLGESAWAKTIPDAAGPMPVVSADNEVCLFVPTDKGLIRKAYDSSGSDKASVSSGVNFEIRFASSAQDGFFIAGYEELANGDHKPVARIHDKNGILRSVLEPSTRRDCRSAYFTGAGQKDNVNWLLSGGSRENPAQGYRAYVRQVRDEGSRLAVLWELTGDDFDGKASGVKCGNITAAVYARGYWLVAGESLVFDVMGNPVKASFTAEISNEGKIQKVDTSFKNMTFNKIVMDSNGSCYLAGDEQRGNENFAVLVKYGANAKLTLSQPASHSYYHDAVFDALYNRIILAGTLRAKNEAGNGGVPFIDAFDIEKSSLVWREELSDVLFNKASVVTAIKPAPDYGFVITLSGVSDYYDKPYMIARINSQGKLIKELQK